MPSSGGMQRVSGEMRTHKVVAEASAEIWEVQTASAGSSEASAEMLSAEEAALVAVSAKAAISVLEAWVAMAAHPQSRTFPQTWEH